MTYLAAVAPPVPVPSRDPAPATLAVAEALQPDLAQGFQIDALRLRLEMERAFGAAADPLQGRGPFADAYPPLGGDGALPAILDAAAHGAGCNGGSADHSA